MPFFKIIFVTLGGVKLKSKSKTNLGGENPISCPEGWFECECTCTCIPPNEGDDPENPTSAMCNGKNDCCSTTHGIFSDNPHCADHNKPSNYTAPDERNCSMTCPQGQNHRYLSKIGSSIGHL